MTVLFRTLYDDQFDLSNTRALVPSFGKNSLGLAVTSCLDFYCFRYIVVLHVGFNRSNIVGSLLPYSITAGDLPVALCGVFLYDKRNCCTLNDRSCGCVTFLL
ncbi:hypothetical protein ACOME3_010626 [Neoechinorhynchus agilis]